MITTDAEPPALGIAAATLAEVMSHGELGTEDRRANWTPTG